MCVEPSLIHSLIPLIIFCVFCVIHVKVYNSTNDQLMPCNRIVQNWDQDSKYADFVELVTK